MSISSARVSWTNQFQLTPIILTGGIATAQGGKLPIISLTDGAGAASNINSHNIDSFFANYYPLPGATLIQNQISTYPFANQAIAANAIISQPLNVSMMMICPAGKSGGFAQKKAKMIALQSALSQHNNSGGTYSVVTPSYIYTDCIMVSMRDVSGGDNKQTQYQWQIDFVQPLVTLQAATAALNNLTQKLSDGTSQFTIPNLQSAISLAGPSGISNFSSSLTSGLSQSLGTAGIPIDKIENLVTSNISTAIANGFSSSDLQGLISSNLQLSAASAGLSFSTLQSIIGTKMTSALQSVGLSQNRLTTFAVTSLQQVAQSGRGLSISNPFLAAQ